VQGCTVHFDSKNVLIHKFSNFCPGKKYKFTLTFVFFLHLVQDLKLDMPPVLLPQRRKVMEKGKGFSLGVGGE
jgi:hypothetical protein